MSVAAAATQLWSRCARCTHHPIIDGGSASASTINDGGSASAASSNDGGSASASAINDGGSASGSAIINGGGSSRGISGGHRPWK